MDYVSNGALANRITRISSKRESLVVLELLRSRVRVTTGSEEPSDLDERSRKRQSYLGHFSTLSASLLDSFVSSAAVSKMDVAI